MANTVKVSREVKQHEGRKFMTAKGIAEMSGIAHGALTSRLYRMKQEHPDHVHYFADEVPAYYDEFAFRYIVKDIKKHPVYRINNQQKYEKFKQLYGEPKSQDAVALQQIKERGALPMIDRGDIRQAIDRCSNIWASLPGAGYGQFEHKADSLIAKFKEAGGTVREIEV